MLIFLGAGSLSPEILWASRIYYGYDGPVLFFDENRKGGLHLGYQLTNDMDIVEEYINDFCKDSEEEKYIPPNIIFSVWSPKIKKKFYKKIRPMYHKFLIPINASKEYCHPSLKIKKGCFITLKNFITTGVEFGKCVTINFGNNIAHDCRIGDFTTISTGCTINGNVKIGKDCYIGTGSIISNNINIGNNVFITAGSVITKDIPKGMRAIGNPARYFEWKNE